MRTLYTNLDLRLPIDGRTFYVLNLVYERFQRVIPRHSHGLDSYELHYIPYGEGTVGIDDKSYHVGPNTLYMTGPYVEHEQVPNPQNPMVEYCVYFKLAEEKSGRAVRADSVAERFARTPFWFGQDTQDMYPVLQQVFFELEHRYEGYLLEVQALLTQCIVKAVRNYAQGKNEMDAQAQAGEGSPNLVDSKYIIAEESFLYEYETLTLEVLSNRLALSTRQTERFLKEYYGRTFLQKKTEARMSAAKVLLADPRLSIAAIAERLNYSSTQHFSYAFRQYFGMSASAYRAALP